MHANVKALSNSEVTTHKLFKAETLKSLFACMHGEHSKALGILTFMASVYSEHALASTKEKRAD